MSQETWQKLVSDSWHHCDTNCVSLLYFMLSILLLYIAIQKEINTFTFSLCALRYNC